MFPKETRIPPWFSGFASKLPRVSTLMLNPDIIGLQIKLSLLFSCFQNSNFFWDNPDLIKLRMPMSLVWNKIKYKPWQHTNKSKMRKWLAFYYNLLNTKEKQNACFLMVVLLYFFNTLNLSAIFVIHYNCYF